MTPKEAQHQYLKQLMYNHRELIKQYHRLKNQFGHGHLGVKRTIFLIEQAEYRMSKYIPVDAVQRFCERL